MQTFQGRILGLTLHTLQTHNPPHRFGSDTTMNNKG
jgi:hypothetical protein